MSGYASPVAPFNGSIKSRFEALDADRNPQLRRTELYSAWTLPYILPETNTKQDEIQGNLDSIGAQATNHLSNLIAETVFSPQRSFFRLELTDAMKAQLVPNDQNGAAALQEIDAELSKVEQSAMKRLVKIGYRTAAVLALKNLIVTGNGLVYHPEGEKAQVYNFRDWVCVRDISGFPVEMVTRDCKALETFSPEIQEALLRTGRFRTGLYQNVTIYTRIWFMGGKYHVRQAADNINLDTYAVYPKHLCPWLPLTWNLIRGENYGRGLVEDFAGAFHAVTMLTDALTRGACIAADIKFLVHPASGLDVEELNKAVTGSYHLGKEGDITTPELRKQNDFQLASALLERFSREISRAFMMQQGTTRDAERVTAVEIRRDALELERSFGGIYSRFAEEWQSPLARILLDDMDIHLGQEKALEPVIVTGLDSLSRNGEMDNLQQFLADLGMLDQIPEDARREISMSRFMMKVGSARGVDYASILKTPQEKQQELQQQMALQQQLMQQQTNQQVQAEVGKQVAKEQ